LQKVGKLGPTRGQPSFKKLSQSEQDRRSNLVMASGEDSTTADVRISKAAGIKLKSGFDLSLLPIIATALVILASVAALYLRSDQSASAPVKGKNRDLEPPDAGLSDAVAPSAPPTTTYDDPGGKGKYEASNSDSALPAGWEVGLFTCGTSKEQTQYFYNHDLQKSQWEKPTSTSG